MRYICILLFVHVTGNRVDSNVYLRPIFILFYMNLERSFVNDLFNWFMSADWDFFLFLSRDAKLIKIIDFKFHLFIITKDMSVVSVELLTTCIRNCSLKTEIIFNNNKIIVNTIQNRNFLKFCVTMSCDYYVNYIDSGILQRM